MFLILLTLRPCQLIIGKKDWKNLPWTEFRSKLSPICYCHDQLEQKTKLLFPELFNCSKNGSFISLCLFLSCCCLHALGNPKNTQHIDPKMQSHSTATFNKTKPPNLCLFTFGDTWFFESTDQQGNRQTVSEKSGPVHECLSYVQ